MNLQKNREEFQKLKNLPNPKAIIFDWDNTLVNTWPLIQYSIDEVMVKMNKEPWGLEKVKDQVHKSMRESFPEIFGDKWQQAGEIYKNSYREIHLQKLKFLPNSIELIDKIHDLGILQFVVSNKIGDTLRKEAEKLGVTNKFFTLIGAQDAKDDKPSKEPVEMALLGTDLDLNKDEIWFIGDTIADIQCAFNSNCRAIAFSCDEGVISKTIPSDIIKSCPKNSVNGANPLPLFFDHNELIEILS